MKNTVLLISLFLATATSIVITYTFLNKKIDNIIVVDVIKVLNEFKMKKDLEAKVEVRLAEYTNRLDSLKALLKITDEQSNKANFIKLASVYRNLEEEFQNTYEISNRTINEEVWKRLNPLIKEFGKENNYRLMIGANGMGTVLYNTDVVDKTGDLIKYINSKYEKGY